MSCYGSQPAPVAPSPVGGLGGLAPQPGTLGCASTQKLGALPGLGLLYGATPNQNVPNGIICAYQQFAAGKNCGLDDQGLLGMAQNAMNYKDQTALSFNCWQQQKWATCQMNPCRIQPGCMYGAQPDYMLYKSPEQIANEQQRQQQLQQNAYSNYTSGINNCNQDNDSIKQYLQQNPNLFGQLQTAAQKQAQALAQMPRCNFSPAQIAAPPPLMAKKGGTIKPVGKGITKEKVTISPNLDAMQYELMSVKHFKKAK